MYGLALGVLHQVDVLRDALGVGVEGAHLRRQLNEFGGVQSPRTFADMANYLTGRDGGVDSAGMTELLVPRLFDDAAQ